MEIKTPGSLMGEIHISSTKETSCNILCGIIWPFNVENSHSL